MRFAIFLAVALVLVSSSGSSQSQDAPAAVEGDTELGPELPEDADDFVQPGDGDPRIDPSEVVAQAIDSRDPAWKPAYEWHSGETGADAGAASLACDGRQTCESYKTTEVSKSESSTTTGATR